MRIAPYPPRTHQMPSIPGITQCSVEVVRALLVGPGEISVLPEHMRAGERLPAERGRVVDGGLQFLRTT